MTVLDFVEVDFVVVTDDATGFASNFDVTAVVAVFAVKVVALVVAAAVVVFSVVVATLAAVAVNADNAVVAVVKVAAVVAVATSGCVSSESDSSCRARFFVLLLAARHTFVCHIIIICARIHSRAAADLRATFAVLLVAAPIDVVAATDAATGAVFGTLVVASLAGLL